MIRKIKLLSWLLFISVSALCQRTILGRVVDAITQKPIENATVMVSNSNLGTFSNRLGFFQLEINPELHKALTIFHMGHAAATLSIPEQDKFLIPLEKEYIRLNRLNLFNYLKQDSAHHAKDVSVEKNGDPLIESDACYPGGMNGFYDHIGNTLALVFDPQDKEVNIAFTINEKGKAVDIFFSDSTESIQPAVTKAFETMPDWKPATQRQVAVPQHFVLPLIKRKLVPVGSNEMIGLGKWIQKNLRYPVHARKMGIEGTSYVEFKVGYGGEVTDVLVVQTIDQSITQELRRLFTTISSEVTRPIFEQSGPTKFIVPVIFGLEEELPQKPFRGVSDGVMLPAINVTVISVVRERQPVSSPPRRKR